MKWVLERPSLVNQITRHLRGELESGAWSARLPGEHTLCATYNVSRVTVRAALKKLEAEGLLSCRRGASRKILGAPKRQPVARNQQLVLLTPFPLTSLLPSALFWVDFLRSRLAETGCALQVYTSRAAFASSATRALEALTRRLRPACWLLFRGTETMHQWFEARGLPTVVVGSLHDGIKLPSVDLAHRTVCRHAAGLFLAKGYQDLALLSPASGTAAELESERGFVQDAGASRSPDVKTEVVWHDATVPGLCRQLDLLLQRQRPPRALLVARPEHTVTTLSYLASKGLRFPADFALISRDDDPFLKSLVPSIARYSASPTAFARKLYSVVSEVILEGSAAPVAHRVLPQFIGGQTFG